MKLILLNIDDPDIPKLKEMMLESKYFSISDSQSVYRRNEFCIDCSLLKNWVLREQERKWNIS